MHYIYMYIYYCWTFLDHIVVNCRLKLPELEKILLGIFITKRTDRTCINSGAHRRGLALLCRINDTRKQPHLLFCCSAHATKRWPLCRRKRASVARHAEGLMVSVEVVEWPSSVFRWSIHIYEYKEFQYLGRLQLKCDGPRWRTGGEVKGKLANGVGSQYPSHYLGTWCIQHYYRFCAQLGCQYSTELTPPLI